MLKNVYAPLSAGTAQERLLEIIANNLANTNTTGYKEEKMSFKSMLSDPWRNYPNPLPSAPFKTDMNDLYPLHGNEMDYMSVSDIKTDFSQGSLKKTGNNLDIALEGDGFFTISTPFGERYTRDGSFSLSPDGILISKNGNVIQGEAGIISGLNEADLKINSNGDVFNGDKFVDKIKIINIKDKNTLEKLGNNLYIYNGSPENISIGQNKVSQGFIENSNANPMINMTNMIIAHRNYEALQKAIKAHDESMRLSAEKVGTIQQ